MIEYTDINKDISIIEDFFLDEEYTITDLCAKFGISETDYLAIKNGIQEPTKEQLEGIYNFAYNNKLYLNKITWQECIDEYRHGNVEAMVHGARTYIKGDIRLDVNSESNDFGQGFYIGQTIEQAGMFVSEEPNSSLYIVTFDKAGLNVAFFDVSIEWMIAVALCRNLIPEYESHPFVKEIKDKIDNCDYVLAPIADNRIFECIDLFIAGEITDLQCLYAISATHLGYQCVIKSQKALKQVEMIKHLYLCSVEKSLYNQTNDIESITSVNKSLIAKKRFTNQGKYIDELLSETNSDITYKEL